MLSRCSSFQVKGSNDFNYESSRRHEIKPRSELARTEVKCEFGSFFCTAKQSICGGRDKRHLA
uniref:Uncharacterized protein n=1 Tax=Arundo donax TaxID=35708 RepID=A0A0A9C8M3_ARUDO